MNEIIEAMLKKGDPLIDRQGFKIIIIMTRDSHSFVNYRNNCVEYGEIIDLIYFKISTYVVVNIIIESLRLVLQLPLPFLYQVIPGKVYLEHCFYEFKGSFAL